MLSAGGGACGAGCGANHLDGQIFSPPYLFAANGSLAPRPAITAAPALGEPGADVTVVATGSIAKFSMVRLSATTHAMNTDQRLLPVPFTNGGGSYTLELENNPNVLVPGYYWIFAIDTAGVPSVGRTFQVLRDDGSPATGLELEAETAVLAGSFAVGSDAAARNGHYISLPTGSRSRPGPTSPNRALLAFVVAQAGQYQIEAARARARAARRTRSSSPSTALPASAYLWELRREQELPDRLRERHGGVDPVIVALAAGPHTVEVIHRETGTRLDWMRLVSVGRSAAAR